MVNYHLLTDMYKISRVTIKDLIEINKLENQLFGNITKLDFFNKTLLNENFEFIKLVFNSEIIGFSQFFWNKSDCDIVSIGIIEKFQKMGYGKKMIEYIKSLNFKNIYVEVSSNNKNAIIFYKKLKFVEIGVRKNYYKKLKSNAILLKL